MVELVATLVVYLVGMHVKMNQSLKQQLPSDINYLLILGSTLKTNEMTQTLRSRLEKGAELLKKHPHLKVVVTGGKGSEFLLAEAQLMQKVFIEEYGIDSERIILEDQAHNTFENLLLSKPLLPDEKIAIITNDFHSIRTSFLAKRIGIKHIMIGARSPSHKRYKWELREHLAIVKSWLFDRESL
ncbi:YdcF family protein [Turicibacter sp. TJ11]|uniref:YdcF family protein n=1 Tax=Turicibacter sp. TJ11 TaxID=2806443 RepID=UPI001F33C4D4|nr:YdcF family protein [Turicibacter sp. TJ11]